MTFYLDKHGRQVTMAEEDYSPVPQRILHFWYFDKMQTGI